MHISPVSIEGAKYEMTMKLILLFSLMGITLLLGGILARAYWGLMNEQEGKAPTPVEKSNPRREGSEL